MRTESLVLANCVDTWASADNPTVTHPDTATLGLKTGGTDAYLYFDLSALPPRATVPTGMLRVHTKGSWGGTSQTLTVRPINSEWKVARLTANTKPTVGPESATKTQSSGADAHEWAIPVGPLIQLVADGARWYGFRLATSDTVFRRLYASGSGDFQPTLTLTYSTAPSAPTDLSPAAGRAVSIAKPVLRFDFTDDSGSTALQAVQVQINPTNDFTAPAFDSGVVAATVPELDLALTTYLGLANAAETRWRVRVQDGAGLWSPWSDPALFRRDNKGTLAITYPAAAPSDFVSEWKPAVTWSLTGETQKAWQVQVAKVADPTLVHHDSGRVKGIETAYTLPVDVLVDAERYRLTVRVWDSKDRENTPSDPPWTETTRDFGFVEQPTPTPVANLTAVAVLPRAWVDLGWTRATAPHSFSIMRDGKVLVSGLAPADLLVSGTTYAYRDKTAAPRRTHTWVVQSTVNGETSTANPTVSLKVTPLGFWLADDVRDIDVFITGKNPGTWVMPEDAATHVPLGARTPVRVTQSQQGWHCLGFTGMLRSAAGKTADEWEDRMMRLKERPGQTLTLSLGNETLRVVIGNVSTGPTEEGPETKSVAFDFWQVGKFNFDPRL